MSHSLVNELRQTDVRNAGGVLAQQVHVRIEDRRVDRLAVLA